MKKIIYLLFAIVCFAATILVVHTIVPHNPYLDFSMLIYTAAGGVGTPFAHNMPYLPQFLTWDDGGNPLTSIRIETQEDGVLMSLDAAAIAAIDGYMQFGALAANNILLRLAGGQLKRNVTISGVTSAVGAITFYAGSDQPGKFAYKVANAEITAGNVTTFDNFTAIFTPTMATATDYAQVTYRNGHRQTFAIEDLTNLSVLFQQVPGIILNNINAYVYRAEYLCAADTPAYVLSVKLGA